MSNKLEMFCNKNEVQIEFSGFANVSLWGPSEIFNIDVRAKYRHKSRTPFDDTWSGLRDALCRLHTGDYQSYEIDGGLEVIVTRTFSYVDTESRRVVRESTRSRCFVVNKDTCDLADLFA